MTSNEIIKYSASFAINVYWDEKYYPDDKEFSTGANLKDLGTYEKWMEDNIDWANKTGTTIYEWNVCYLPEITEKGIVNDNYATYWEPRLITKDEKGMVFIFIKNEWIHLKEKFDDPFSEFVRRML